MSGTQSLVLKVKGLFRQPNNLGSVPDGALEEADNVYIKRDDTAEPRRGFNFYGSAFGDSTSRAEQLIIYKKKLIRHYSTVLARDDGSGNFTSYSGSFTSPDPTMKIRGSELNGNLYITSNEGVKRLDDLPSEFERSGVTGALDLEADLVDTEGFFLAENQLAYRILWGFRDANENLLLGAPSPRVVISNPGNTLVLEDFNTLLGLIDAAGFMTDIDYASLLTLASNSDAAQILGNTTPALSGLKGLAKKLTDDATNTGAALPVDYEALVGTEVDFTSLANYLDALITELNAQPYTTTSYDIEARRSQQVELTFTVPDEVTSDYFYQVYRSDLSGDILATPLDELQLVFEGNPTTAELSSKIVSVVDITPDSFRGVDLYTNPNQETLAQANDRPPFAKDITVFKNSLFFSNTKTVQRLNTAMLSTATATGDITNVTNADPAVITSANHGLESGDTVEIAGTGIGIVDDVHVITVIDPNTFSIPVDSAATSSSGFWRTGVNDDSSLTFSNGVDTFTVSFDLAAEDSVTGEAQYFLAGTPAQNVDDTARSLVRVINRYPGNTFIYAYYQPTEGDIPGKIRFDSRDLEDPVFYITASDTQTGDCFDPVLPITGTTYASNNELSPNRVYYSKNQQPDAVPSLNYFDVGRKDSEIIRIVGLRDSLFIFKEDGIYRAIGDTLSNLTVSLFDNSVNIIAPESPAVGNNQIFLLTDQGIIKLSDTGRDVISRPIEDLILPLNSPKFTGFVTATFGLFYVTERQYYLWTVTQEADVQATRCFVYNTFTEAWSILPIEKTCGIVNPLDDKLYLGAGDVNWLEQERKNFDLTDYSDRQYDTQVTEIDGTVIKLNSIVNLNVGDVITQKEYLNPFKFNTVLYKLDQDVGITDIDYVEDVGITTKAEIADGLVALGTKLDADASTPEITGTITSITAANPAVITSVAHGLVNGQYVTISGTDSTPAVDGLYPIQYIDDDNFSIDVETTIAGTTGSFTTSYLAMSSGPSDPSSLQDIYNNIINALNHDPRVVDIDYQESEQTLDYYSHVISIQDDLIQSVTVENVFDWDLADVTFYNHIPTKVTWTPLHAGDPSIYKQFRECELMMSSTTSSVIDISFATDIMQGFKVTNFINNLDSGWGVDSWGLDPWGDYPGPRDFRTYIPRAHQRCRFIQPRYEHARAFEDYLMVGISLTFQKVDVRVNR